MTGHVCCATESTQKPLSNAVCLLAEPKLPNFEANFRGLLARSRYNQPKEDIMNAIVRHLAARMIACCNIDQAEDLYHDASLLPGASTVNHLLTQHNLRVNGPLYLRCEGRQNPSPFGCLDMQEADWPFDNLIDGTAPKRDHLACSELWMQVGAHALSNF